MKLKEAENCIKNVCKNNFNWPFALSLRWFALTLSYGLFKMNQLWCLNFGAHCLLSWLPQNIFLHNFSVKILMKNSKVREHQMSKWIIYSKVQSLKFRVWYNKYFAVWYEILISNQSSKKIWLKIKANFISSAFVLQFPTRFQLYRENYYSHALST